MSAVAVSLPWPHLTVALLAFGLAACTSVDGMTTGSLAPPDAASVATDPRVTIYTTRAAVNGGKSRPWYGTERARTPAVARARLNSPYEGGAFSLASVGLADWSIASVEPLPNRLQWSPLGAPRDVLIYVHGFNQDFQVAVLDTARIADGIKFRGEAMLFTWPSKSALLDYIYDRESAMWSRDAFEGMLAELILHPRVNNIHVVAHSMGTMLTVEALRQLYARQGEVAVIKIGAVVLAAPDIDIDVFESSIKRIGGLANRITVLTATNDRALGMLKKFAGGVTRVGAAEAGRLQALGLRVIDASQYGGSGINHDLFLSNEQVRAQVREAINQQGGMAASVTAGETFPGFAQP